MKLAPELQRLPVTSAQLRVLLAIDYLIAVHGRCTVRSIAAATGLRSLSTVHFHLTALRRHQLIRWEPGRSGTIRPLFSSFTTTPKEPTP